MEDSERSENHEQRESSLADRFKQHLAWEQDPTMSAESANRGGQSPHQRTGASASGIGSEGPGDTTGRRSTVFGGRIGNSLLAKLCIAFVIFHLGMTVLYLAPSPGPIRRVATAYMEPVFKQSWWVFAPDPTSTNVYLLVEGKKDGHETGWFNVTSCDINKAILHHPVPNRRYLAAFQLVRHYQLGTQGLPKAAVDIPRRDMSGSNWDTELRQQLKIAGATPYQINNFMKSDRAMNNLGSLIAEARWGNVSDVRIQIKTVHTKPFPQRNENVSRKVDITQSGYLPINPGNANEKKAVSELYGAGSGC